MNYQEQLNQAADTAAKDYLKEQVKEIPEMDSEAQQYCEEDHKQGFLKGAEWTPEISIEDKEAAAGHALSQYSVYDETDKLIACENGFKAGISHAKKQIAKLQSQCEAKDKAITEALAIIDEKEQEISDLKAGLNGMFLKQLGK